MWVTCYTDASFSKRKGGAWAVWLRADRGRLVRRGRCPRYVTTSFEAELAAIYAGVYLAWRTWGRQVTGVLTCSDCQAALLAIERDALRRPSDGARALHAKIRALVAESGMALEGRWVKAHQDPGTSTAAYLNGKCDELAKQARYESSRRRR